MAEQLPNQPPPKPDREIAQEAFDVIREMQQSSGSDPKGFFEQYMASDDYLTLSDGAKSALNELIESDYPGIIDVSAGSQAIGQEGGEGVKKQETQATQTPLPGASGDRGDNGPPNRPFVNYSYSEGKLKKKMGQNPPGVIFLDRETLDDMEKTSQAEVEKFLEESSVVLDTGKIKVGSQEKNLLHAMSSPDDIDTLQLTLSYYIGDKSIPITVEVKLSEMLERLESGRRKNKEQLISNLKKAKQDLFDQSRSLTSEGDFQMWTDEMKWLSREIKNQQTDEVLRELLKMHFKDKESGSLLELMEKLSELGGASHRAEKQEAQATQPPPPPNNQPAGEQPAGDASEQSASTAGANPPPGGPPNEPPQPPNEPPQPPDNGGDNTVPASPETVPPIPPVNEQVPPPGGGGPREPGEPLNPDVSRDQLRDAYVRARDNVARLEREYASYEKARGLLRIAIRPQDEAGRTRTSVEGELDVARRVLEDARSAYLGEEINVFLNERIESVDESTNKNPVARAWRWLGEQNLEKLFFGRDNKPLEEMSLGRKMLRGLSLRTLVIGGLAGGIGALAGGTIGVVAGVTSARAFRSVAAGYTAAEIAVAASNIRVEGQQLGFGREPWKQASITPEERTRIYSLNSEQVGRLLQSVEATMILQGHKPNSREVLGSPFYTALLERDVQLKGERMLAQQHPEEGEDRVNLLMSQWNTELNEELGRLNEQKSRAFRRGVATSLVIGGATHMFGDQIMHGLGSGINYMRDTASVMGLSAEQKASIIQLGHDPREYVAYSRNWSDDLEKMHAEVDKGRLIDIHDIERVRNIASWRGTPLGDRANSLMTHWQEKTPGGQSLIEKSGIVTTPVLGAHKGFPADLYTYVESAIQKDIKTMGSENHFASVEGVTAHEKAQHLVDDYLKSHYMEGDPNSPEYQSRLEMLRDRVRASAIGERIWVGYDGITTDNSAHPFGYVNRTPEEIFGPDSSVTALAHTFENPKSDAFLKTLRGKEGLSIFNQYYEGKVGLMTPDMKKAFTAHYQELISSNASDRAEGEHFFNNFFRRHHNNLSLDRRTVTSLAYQARQHAIEQAQAVVSHEYVTAVAHQDAANYLARHVSETAHTPVAPVTPATEAPVQPRSPLAPEGDITKGGVVSPSSTSTPEIELEQSLPRHEGEVQLREFARSREFMDKLKTSPEWSNIENLRHRLDYEKRVMHEYEEMSQGLVDGTPQPNDEQMQRQSFRDFQAARANSSALNINTIQRRLDELTSLEKVKTIAQQIQQTPPPTPGSAKSALDELQKANKANPMNIEF